MSEGRARAAWSWLAARDDAARAAAAASNQGLTLVHFSAQLKRFLWHRGCTVGVFRGSLGGVYEMLEGIMGYLGCILCQKRLRLS